MVVKESLAMRRAGLTRDWAHQPLICGVDQGVRADGVGAVNRVRAALIPRRSRSRGGWGMMRL
jgi:hypothetical protein